MEPISVLLVDDEPWILIGLKNLIPWEEEGFQIIGEASDGEKAWEKITCMEPDLILSDIRMPHLNGLSLLERLRKNGITTSVIFISGYSEFEYAQQSLRLGCSDYLVKPVEPEDLLQALRRVRETFQEHEPSESYTSDSTVVRQVVRYLRQNYADPLSLSELAKQYRFSTGYFSSLIKKKAGKSYSELLISIRMEKATELLRSSNKSIEEIAQEVGYDDYFYFSKLYKKVNGITAAAFRKTL